ncbi:hypothetical protein llg_17480 [Luteolibacter sp. LG18]|nr:hypothetical protein llg_17480 [Luteolibacter sp. LG18]
MSQLRKHPEAREAYRKHMAFAAALHGMAKAWEPEHEREVPEPVVIEPFRWQPWVAAAALIAMLAVAAVFVLGRRGPPANVTAGSGGSWAYVSGGIGSDGEFRPGTSLRVDRGSVELVTRQRTRAVVEAPALVTMDTAQQVSLANGNAWFEGEQDTPLTVVTGLLRAVSSGARFGVAITTAGHRLQVKAGELRVTPAFPGAPTIILGSGQAATVDDSGRWTSDLMDAGLFLDRLPRQATYIHWSFDEAKTGVFPASGHGMGEDPIKVTGTDLQAAAPRLVAGAFGRGLDLTGGDVFAESRFAGISGGGPRTVALWIKGSPIIRRTTPNRAEYTPSVVQWGDESIDGGSWTFRAHCATGIIGSQWGRGGLLTAGKIGTRSVLDEQWHHIVSVFTGEVNELGEADVRHYIDGQRVPTTNPVMRDRIDTRIGTSPETRLRVAWDPRSSTANVPVMVDELFIVRGALSDAQIKTLWQENRIAEGE